MLFHYHLLKTGTGNQGKTVTKVYIGVMRNDKFRLEKKHMFGRYSQLKSLSQPLFVTNQLKK